MPSYACGLDCVLPRSSAMPVASIFGCAALLTVIAITRHLRKSGLPSSALRDRQRGPAARAKMHALLVAIVLWTMAAAVSFVGTGNRSFTGRLKGADFIEFYTLGSLVRGGQLSALYDVDAFSHTQATLVPDSADLFYPPLYPPQTALLFAPLTSLSYGHAGLLWTPITAILYACIVWRTYRAIRSSIHDAWLVALLAMAVPPFWQLALHGQITPVAFGSVCLGWMC